MSWFRTLARASTSRWRDAFREVLIVGLLSIVPLLLKSAYFYIQSLKLAKPLSVGQALYAHVISGELLFFSIGIVASVLYISSKDFKDGFQQRVWFILVSVFCYVICTFFIGLDPEFRQIPESIVRVASFMVFILALSMYLVLKVFESFSGVDVVSNQAREEEDLTDALSRSRS